MTVQKFNKLNWRIVVAILVVGALSVVGSHYFKTNLRAQESVSQSSLILMDTVVDVRVDGRNSEKLLEQAFATMKNLEQTLSRFVDTSEVSKINKYAGEWVEVSTTTLELIQLGLKMSEITAGAFDITIGAVLDLWGFGSDFNQVPSLADLSSALATVDYQQVEIDLAQNKVRIPSDTVLDLGGIAKGYIVDQGIELLRAEQVPRAIINAGGDISVIGRRPDDQPWRIGVQNPDRPSEISWILPLDNQSVVTSGDYQRYFVHDGQRYHHIINPQTGYPAEGLRSVTIVGADAATCDALSTAIFILGWEQGQEILEELPNIEGILVSSTDVWVSSGLANLVIEQ